MKLYKRDSWEACGTITDGIDAVVSLCIFSPCGTFIAGGCRDGKIVVWDSKNHNSVSSIQHDKVG